MHEPIQFEKQYRKFINVNAERIKNRTTDRVTARDCLFCAASIPELTKPLRENHPFITI